jgi:hypothetical protein
VINLFGRDYGINDMYDAIVSVYSDPLIRTIARVSAPRIAGSWRVSDDFICGSWGRDDAEIWHRAKQRASYVGR